jgi:hypothetical protein
MRSVCCTLLEYSTVKSSVHKTLDTIFKCTGQQHANPDGESATNRATKTGRQKVCQRHNNQPRNAGVSPQVQKGTVGLTNTSPSAELACPRVKDKVGEDKKTKSLF